VAVPRNKAVVGANAFRHASGIHQDGVLKWRENYEVLDPAAIGHARGSEIVLGKLSGRAGFVARAQQLGFSLTDAALDAAFARFQEIADAQPVVEDDELRAICAATSEVAVRAAGACGTP
jgi:2-isopropylmalate synthase